ncbi:hypothetical protein Patl1_18897 [Pistacia atlantica]|uniref:Uncharacterized protein n=1 Tax=Pistacia atlantica TaxID=434234 RepID=A0ACC1C2V0_9ROSI|nr:hypothetical protein Patl1_18897 [Pistacia atlantica]
MHSSFHSLLTQTDTDPSSNPSGSFEVRVKERYILKFQSDDGVEVVLEDITSLEFRFVLSIPLHFPSPQARTVYIKDIVSSLNLDPHVYELVSGEMTEVVAETLAKTKGKEDACCTSYQS